MRQLIVVMVGAATVQRVVEAEGDLAVWGRVLLGRIAAGWLQRLMVSMPASSPDICLDQMHWTGLR